MKSADRRRDARSNASSAVRSRGTPLHTSRTKAQEKDQETPRRRESQGRRLGLKGGGSFRLYICPSLDTAGGPRKRASSSFDARLWLMVSGCVPPNLWRCRSHSRAPGPGHTLARAVQASPRRIKVAEASLFESYPGGRWTGRN